MIDNKANMTKLFKVEYEKGSTEILFTNHTSFLLIKNYFKGKVFKSEL